VVYLWISISIPSTYNKLLKYLVYQISLLPCSSSDTVRLAVACLLGDGGLAAVVLVGEAVALVGEAVVAVVLVGEAAGLVGEAVAGTTLAGNTLVGLVVVLVGDGTTGGTTLVGEAGKVILFFKK
jgi:hypothetical protein